MRSDCPSYLERQATRSLMLNFEERSAVEPHPPDDAVTGSEWRLLLKWVGATAHVDVGAGDDGVLDSQLHFARRGGRKISFDDGELAFVTIGRDDNFSRPVHEHHLGTFSHLQGCADGRYLLCHSYYGSFRR